MPTIEDITQGLNSLITQHSSYKGKTTQLHTAGFNALVADLNVWLETNEKENVTSAKDKENLARVLFFDNDIKGRFQVINNKIGEFDTAKLSPLAAAAPAVPQFTDLNQQFSANDSAGVRKDVAAVLGIADKHHQSHGSNFSKPQTLRQIIADVCAKVQGTGEWTRVQGLLKHHYPSY